MSKISVWDWGPAQEDRGGEEGDIQYIQKAQLGRPLPDRVPTLLPSNTQVSHFPLEKHHGWSQMETQVWNRFHFPPRFCLQILLLPAHQPPPVRTSTWPVSGDLPSHRPLPVGSEQEVTLSLNFHSNLPCLGEATRTPASPDLWSYLPTACLGQPPHGLLSTWAQHICSVTPTLLSKWPPGRGGAGAGAC